MGIYKEFPDDDHFWLVKWIDQFRIPHGHTRSVSVAVQLVQLPISNVGSISRLTMLEVQALLKLKPASGNITEQGQSADTSPIKNTPMKIPRVLVGSLPDLQIGQVFRRQERVATLPTSQRSIKLDLVEASCREIKIGQALEKPTGWDYTYRILNPSEYTDIYPIFEGSRCLVFTQDDIDFVIPRTLIFKTFYAQTTVIANAISSAPWKEASKRLIYEGTLESGLKTGIEPGTGKWNVILQPKVPLEFAFLMALFRFDMHANKCATAIHTQALADRSGEITAPWYASAQIPFKAGSRPLGMRVQGYQLYKPKNGRQRFLVTAISRCVLPTHFPEIGWEKYNSGERSTTPQPTSEPKPYASPKEEKPATSDHSIDSNEDANPERESVFSIGNSFTFENLPTITKLKKTSSKQYTNGMPKPPLDRTEQGSTGENTASKDGLTPTNEKTLIRDPVNRFSHIMVAMESLKKSKFIDRFYEVQAIHPSLRAVRGGVECWNFLSDEARRTGEWPKRAWEILQSSPQSSNPQTSRVPRSALILAIEAKNYFGFWIEIECRTTEGYCSPLLSGIALPDRVLLPSVLECISKAKGINLKTVIEREFSDTLTVNAYRHRPKSKKDPYLNEASVQRIILKSMGLT